MDVETIKKNFDEIRRRKGLKMEDVAGKLGVTRQQVYKYALGGTVTTLCKLAEAIDVEPWELLKPPGTTEEGTSAAPCIICPHCNKPVYLTAYTSEPAKTPGHPTTTEDQRNA